MIPLKPKRRSFPSGVFLPGVDLADFLEHEGDLRGVFDPVHAHFFDSLCPMDFIDEGPYPTKDHRSKRKGGSHAHSHSR
jgi:hypothetical protein